MGTMRQFLLNYPKMFEFAERVGQKSIPTDSKTFEATEKVVVDSTSNRLWMNK